MRSQHGPYHPPLQELLLPLAEYYAERGANEEAATLFYDAMQVVRVNEGPHSAAQLTHLYRLINSLTELGQWQQVDDYQHLALAIASRAYDRQSTEYINTLHKLTSWRLRAWRQNLLSRSNLMMVEEPHFLRELRELYVEALAQRTRPDPSDIDPERMEMLYAQALIEVEIINHLISIPIWLREPQQPRFIRQEVCSTVSTPGGGRQRVCTIQQVPNPEYRAGVREEERIRIDRANQRLARTLDEIATYRSKSKESVTALELDWLAGYDLRLSELQTTAEELLRESRLAASRNW